MSWESLIIEFLKASVVRSSILVGIGAITLWLFKVRHPATRHTVWTAVLTGMLLIPFLSVGGPKLHLQVLPTQQHPAVVERATEVSRPIAMPSFEPATAAPSRTPVPAPPAAVPGIVRSIRMEDAVLVVYLLGLTVVYVRRAAGWLLLRRVLSRSTLRFNGLLRESLNVTAPVTVGVLRPVVLLPVGWGQWNLRARRAVLAHEFAHIRRKDTWTSALAFFVRSLLWFHPLVWWVRREMAQSSELACDLVALHSTVTPAAYAQLLLDWANAAKRAGNRVSLAGLPVAESAGLGRRIDQALAFSRSPGRSRRVGLILALAGLPAISLAAAVTLTEKPAVLSVGSVEIAEPILSVPSPSSGNPASVEQAVGALSAVVTAQTQQPTQQLGVVTGTIRTRTGTPAAAIRVTAIASGDQSPSTARLERSAITDALGRYRIEDVPPGRYLIAAGNSPHFSYYPGGAVASEARVITINASSIMQNVDFSTLGPIVRGRVNRIPPGLPADVIKIILRPEPTSGWRRDPKAGSPLAVDGTFEFSDVQPGSYTVLTNPQPFFLRDDEPAMPGPIWQSTIRVDRDIQDVLLELPAVIFGRVSVDDGSSLPVTQDDQARGTWSKVSVSAGTFATSPTTSVLTSGTRAPVRSDGWFIMPRPPGPTVAIDLPPGYDLKSITSGGVELQQNRLPTAAGSIEIRVTLTRRLDQRE